MYQITKEQFKAYGRTDKAIIFLVLLLILLLIILAYTIIGEIYYSPESKVNYIGLEDEENQKAREIINIINPSYMEHIESITIVKNIRSFCKWKINLRGCRFCIERGGCGGWNYEDNIVIPYSQAEECFISEKYLNIEPYKGSCMKLTLCHEILHSKFPPTEEDWFSPSHQRIFKIAHEGVCYNQNGS